MSIAVSHKDIDILSDFVKSFIFNESDTDFLPIKNDFSHLAQHIEHREDFSQHQRNVLVDVLEQQYCFLSNDDKQKSLVWHNIQLLKNSSTYTLTTGQQIHIFLGPMYVPHKILSAVANCKKLKEQHPNMDFVPIFWMATEDHDFEEIRSVKLWNKNFVWDEASGGAIGNLSCQHIIPIIEEIKTSFNLGEFERSCLNVFEQFYSESATLAEATTKIVNYFFGQYGVIALDANNKRLKEFFKPFIVKEIKESFAYQAVKTFSEKIKLHGFDTQIGARDTSLFLFDNNKRERIDRIENDKFKLVPSGKIYSQNDLLELAETNPQLFSPNVALRPLYEEVILPNIAYFGGAGELAYWFQLVDVFAKADIPFPILMLRKMAVYFNSKSMSAWNELGFTEEDLLQSVQKFTSILNEKITGQSQYAELEADLDVLIQRSCDVSFAIDPQSVKSLKALAKMWKKDLKSHFDSLSQKIIERNNQKISKAWKLKNMIFPENDLQERNLSFLEFLFKFGKQHVDLFDWCSDNQYIQVVEF